MYKFQGSARYIYWTGAELMGLGNENLKWQRTDQWDVGMDAQFLDSRLAAGFDIFYKKTSDLLSSIDIPQANGFRTYTENIGEVKNHGVEAMLGGYVIRNRDEGLRWNVTGKLAYTKNKITKLSDALKEQVEAFKETNEYAKLLYEGYSQNSIYAVPSLGIDPIDGREIFVDKNGNITKTWNASDRVYCGAGEPPFRGMVSNMLYYKDLTLNLTFGFYWGGKQYNGTLISKVEVTNYEIRDGNVDRRVFSERWQNPGDITFFKRYENESTRSSSRFVMDDNAFYLQSASLQYRWDTPFVKKTLRADAMNFSINMSDVFHLASIKRERGLSYPYARNVQIAMSLTF